MRFRHVRKAMDGDDTSVRMISINGEGKMIDNEANILASATIKSLPNSLG